MPHFLCASNWCASFVKGLPTAPCNPVFGCRPHACWRRNSVYRGLPSPVLTSNLSQRDFWRRVGVPVPMWRHGWPRKSRFHLRLHPRNDNASLFRYGRVVWQGRIQCQWHVRHGRSRPACRHWMRSPMRFGAALKAASGVAGRPPISLTAIPRDFCRCARPWQSIWVPRVALSAMRTRSSSRPVRKRRFRSQRWR